MLPKARPANPCVWIKLLEWRRNSLSCCQSFWHSILCPCSKPRWEQSFSLGRCGKGKCGCPAPGSGKVGREASPPACWKIREILFCFGMNPRGFDILGGICWPCKNFSPPLSLSPPLPEFQSHSTGINPRKGSWMVTVKWRGCRAPGSGQRFSSCAGNSRDREVLVEEITQSSLKGKPLSWMPVCSTFVPHLVHIPLSLWVRFQEKLGKHQ